MKKLLILMLVLGMASMANAALVPTVGGSQVAFGDDVLAGLLGLDTTDAIKSFDVELTAAGDVTMDVSGIAYPITFELASTIIGTPTSTVVRISGSQLFGAAQGPGSLITSISFSGEDGTISIFDYVGNVSLGSINVVPEPMTIALLGLGGLFLLRRRK